MTTLIQLTESDIENVSNTLRRKVEISLKCTSISNRLREIAEEIHNNWYIATANKSFEIIESEIQFHSKSLNHEDPFVDLHSLQYSFGRWSLREGGVEITIGSSEYAACLYIRSIRDLETRETVVGPNRSFVVLFRDAGFILDPRASARLMPRIVKNQSNILTVPRVKLPVEEHSEFRKIKLEYLFKPYRFISSDFFDYTDKYHCNLYFDQIALVNTHIPLRNSIYSKYVDAFVLGTSCNDLQSLWEISSRSIRLAGLMGYQFKKFPKSVF